ncbi:MAG: hypothetical protein WC683_16685 [bacterium]
MRYAKWKPFVVVTVISLLLICCGGSTSTSSGTDDSGGETDDSGDETGATTTQDLLADCSSVATPYFSVSPVSLDEAGTNFRYVAPLGSTNPWGGHVLPSGHMYFYVKDDDTTTNFYAPGNVTITKIIRFFNSDYDYNENGVIDSGEEDYSIEYGPCKDVKAYFNHVKGLSAEILVALGAFTDDDCEDAPAASSHKCSKQVSIAVNAGDLLGTFGNRPGNTAIDVGIYDKLATPLDLISPERGVADDGFDWVYKQCFLNYYDSNNSVFTTLDGMIGRYDEITGFEAKTEGSPHCGNLAFDVVGAAKGYWYPDSTTDMMENAASAALIDDEFASDTRQMINVGSETLPNSTATTYNFAKSGSGRINRDFADVTNDGLIYCYDSFQYDWGVNVIFLLKVEDETLKIEKLSYADCDDYNADPSAWVFSSPQTLYR